MNRDLHNGIEAQQHDEDLQTQRAGIVAKYQGQGFVLTIHGVLQRAQYQHGQQDCQHAAP
jgi:hypothetical protein